MAETKVKRIIIVSFQFSVVMKSIEGRLADGGYMVTTIEPKPETVAGYTEDASLFILYLQADIMDEYKLHCLKNLSEIFQRKKLKAILIGEHASKSDFLQAVPALSAFVWMDRPVDADTLKKKVDETIARPSLDPNRKNRILIIDDDPSYAKMMKEFLKDIYKVDVVTAGMQAMTFLERAAKMDPVDLILLDYEMPEMDGPQVLHMLRQKEETKEIPVIFLTGNGTKEAVNRVMQMIPDGYVLKSTPREELIEYIHKILP